MKRDSFLLDWKSDKIKLISRLELYAYVVFTAFSLIYSLPKGLVLSHTQGPLANAFQLITYLALIFPIVFLYKIWNMLQVWPVRTSPGKAVGFLFIPLYGFYWFFVVFAGWASDYNKILSKSGLQKPRAYPRLGVVAALAPIIAFGGFFIKLDTELNGLYVIRENKPVLILYEGQLEKNEEIYRRESNMLLPAPAKSKPSSTREAQVMYSFACLALKPAMTLVPWCLFFIVAIPRANFLAKQFNTGKIHAFVGDLDESENRELNITCPECGHRLWGASLDMVGDIGVCSKCKAEFTIKDTGHS